MPAIVSDWNVPWSVPKRHRIPPRLVIALAVSGAFAPILNPETQITRFFESRWHYPWSEPVRFRRLATAHQQVLAVPHRLIPTPDVTATISAISDPGTSIALVTALILNEPPPVLPDLTSVNVSVGEADDGGASASVRGDE